MADRSLRTDTRPRPARPVPKRLHDRRAATTSEELAALLRPGASDLAGLAAKVETLRAELVVARLGGDEFALLLWNLSEADTTAKAYALERAIAETQVSCGDAVLTVGASVGVAMLAPSNHPAQILRLADQARYARKAARRPT